MKERFNKTGFRLFQKIMELVRKIASADPFEKVKEIGVLGRVIGGFFDKITEPLIHKMSFRSTSLVYDRKRDKPHKGSAIYTFNYINIKKVFKIVFDILIALPVFSFFYSVSYRRFYNAIAHTVRLCSFYAYRLGNLQYYQML